MAIRKIVELMTSKICNHLGNFLKDGNDNFDWQLLCRSNNLINKNRVRCYLRKLLNCHNHKNHAGIDLKMSVAIVKNIHGDFTQSLTTVCLADTRSIYDEENEILYACHFSQHIEGLSSIYTSNHSLLHNGESELHHVVKAKVD